MEKYEHEKITRTYQISIKESFPNSKKKWRTPSPHMSNLWDFIRVLEKEGFWADHEWSYARSAYEDPHANIKIKVIEELDYLKEIESYYKGKRILEDKRFPKTIATFFPRGKCEIYFNRYGDKIDSHPQVVYDTLNDFIINNPVKKESEVCVYEYKWELVDKKIINSYSFPENFNLYDLTDQLGYERNRFRDLWGSLFCNNVKIESHEDNINLKIIIVYGPPKYKSLTERCYNVNSLEDAEDIKKSIKELLNNPSC